MNQFLGKYVTSPFDGNTYCRKNGQFLDHIRSQGYDYQTLFDKFNPDCVATCGCGMLCLFDIRKMVYKQTCGNKECANVISRAKRASRTQNQWDEWKLKYRNAMEQKTSEEVEGIHDRRRKTGAERGSFKGSVATREQTCLQRHGDKKYNNPTQISATKLSWDESRKQLFKDRLAASLGGRSLNDFHTEEMYIIRRMKLEERGDIIPLDQLSEWKLYCRAVRNLSEKTYRKHKQSINPLSLTRGIDQYELDHIVPVFFGFQNNIPIELMASVENLQMLPMSTNRSKGKKYDPPTSTKHEDLKNQN